MSSNIIIGLSWSSEDSIYISEMTNAEDGVNSAQSVGNYEILPSERLVLLRLIQRIKARDRRTWVSGAGLLELLARVEHGLGAKNVKGRDPNFTLVWPWRRI